MESSLSLDLNVEKQARKDAEAKLTKQIDEKCFAIRLDLAKEKKLREEAEERIAKEMADEIGRLHENLESEKRIRFACILSLPPLMVVVVGSLTHFCDFSEDKFDKISKKLNEELVALNEALAAERKVCVCMCASCVFIIQISYHCIMCVWFGM